MDRFAYSLRIALRSLARRPGFTAVVTLTLALGMGANTAIFSLINGVLLQPLPFNEPEGLISVWKAASEPGGSRGSMSYPDLADIEAQAPSVDSLVGMSRTTRTLTGMGEPTLVRVTRVSNGLLETFALVPALGRDIRADEFGPDAAAIAVISHSFWVARFGGSNDLVGETIVLNDISYQIVGVAPPGFEFPDRTQIWYPRSIDPEGCARGCHTWQTIGRLAPGSTVAAAQVEADAIASNLSAAYPDTNIDKRFLVRSLRNDVIGDVSTGLWILLGAVGAVLLIACANVANLMLARAAARQGEVAVRAALGASPSRLAAGFLLESLLLALFGGTLGLLIAGGGLELVRRTSAGTLPRIENVGLDGTVLLFAGATVVAVSFLFGLSPALQLVRAPLTANLAAAGRGAERAGGGRRLRSMLTAAEMCLSVVLLVAAGLLLRTFTQLYAVDLGFETREIVRFTLSLPGARYPELEHLRSTFRALEDEIAALPGVESVGSIYGAPLHPIWTSGDVIIDGRPEPAPGEETGAVIRAVNPRYLETMRIPVLHGRALSAADDSGGREVAVVNETFVRENFPDEDPLGKRVRITVDMGYGSPLWTIVGVAADARYDSLTREPRAAIYVSHGRFGPSQMTLNVRGIAGVRALIEPIRSIVRRMDAEVPMQEIETISDAVARQVAPTRFFLIAVGLFAALAVVLAAIGLYGVMAYLVSQRTREIGVRVALGARRGEIVRMVLGDGLRPAVAGLAAGLGLALAGGRLVEGLLFGATAWDPLVLFSVPLLLSVVALAAIIAPAARASRVDPLVALRSE